MSPSPFNWQSLIAQITDESFGTPPDITFQILEGSDQPLEVKAHKLILAMVSPVFKKMFFTTNVGDKTAKEIKIKETTKTAFKCMIDTIYNTKSIEDSLKGKSVHDVFDVVNLAERYQIPQLRESIKNRLSEHSITDDTVLELAAEAMQYTNLFHEEAQRLLLKCAEFLAPKLKDAQSIITYLSQNENQKEVVSTLLINMSKLPCSNCNYVTGNCQDGKVIKADELREGLIVTNNKATHFYWGATDWGTGRITRVDPTTVVVETIKPGVAQNGLNAKQFGKAPFNKVIRQSNSPEIPAYQFSCN